MVMYQKRERIDSMIVLTEAVSRLIWGNTPDQISERYLSIMYTYTSSTDY